MGEGPFSIPQYNMSLWICIPNLKFLSLTIVEISLTKNLERKKKEQTQGRTNRRMPICNPTIQLAVVNLYTKYEVSILNGCGDIFDKKVLWNYGRTDGGTDGTTDRCKPVYPPPPTFSKRGYNESSSLALSLKWDSAMVFSQPPTISLVFRFDSDCLHQINRK